MTITLERRTWEAPVEFRKESDRLVARGYAYKFGTLSQNLGGFVETIEPGAGARSVEESDIVALANHDPSLLLGRKSSGTLRLRMDDEGLGYEIDLPDTSTGRDWAVLLERRDVIGSSFGFRVSADGDDWGQTPDGFPLRRLTDFTIRDVGPVTFPAYTSTEAAMRSLAESRSLDLGDLVEAAAAGELRSLITPEPEPEKPSVAPARSRFIR